ncbi:MAG TPA: PstS family phosphate ABC transporter substrate-binding protein [Actinomycetota bacterium]|nr:PstS family phosphate ABC transporter substrate-binding protein [Actinomycetota bacterium]
MGKSRTFLAALITLALTAAACGGQNAAQQGDGSLSGTVLVDGSSTVFPVTEAVAEEFQRENRGVQVTVGVSGTGGGFKKFCAGETDISNASRPIKDAEATECQAAGIEYEEVAVAIDALAVVVNNANDWIADDCITPDQLKAMWDEGSTVRTWRDVDPSWPDTPIKFYAPGHDSGTFDYFTEAINGASQRSRTDGVQFSEDDNVLVQGVSGDRGAIGYFGHAYYEENADDLKVLKIDGGNGCVEPSRQTIQSDTYKPLARPIYIYPKKAAAQRPEVAAFLRFYMENVNELASDVGYYPLPEAEFERYDQVVRSMTSG